MIEIYWDDLTPEKQAEILDLFGDNCNWDVIPIAVIPGPEQEPSDMDTPSPGYRHGGTHDVREENHESLV